MQPIIFESGEVFRSITVSPTLHGIEVMIVTRGQEEFTDYLTPERAFKLAKYLVAAADYYEIVMGKMDEG